MAGPIPPFTEDLIQRWIKAGRGQGEGSQYFPWYTIFDVRGPSLRTRIFSSKNHRICHLLSLLELILFYHHEFRPSVIDIREQFPLFPREESFDISKEIGIQHPTVRATGCPIVVTTDQLVTVRNGLSLTWEAWSVKYLSDLAAPRTLDKLEIERRYWRRRNIPWRLFTDKDVPPVLFANYQFLHRYRDKDSLDHLTPAFINQATNLLRAEVGPHTVLAGLSADCDRLCHQKPGTTLQVARHLMANGTWPLDLRKPITPRTPLSFQTSNQ